mmetsp:Transcript_53083/g.125388  ORF Transcript_53083/g.125388 Transcript_53083/m.125388 type:complete len:393 (-) Transcript_53083:379-1557(-)
MADDAMAMETVVKEDAMEVVSKDPISFTYVYIPCDDTKSMEERTMNTTKDKVLGCLLDVFRPHFAAAGKLETPEQRQALKDQIQQQMTKSGQPGQNPATQAITDEQLEMMCDSQTVDIVPLIPAVAAGKFISVTCYVDDRGSAKQLPHNRRATALVSASGGSVAVLGDAFVARALDNEAEDMVRYDFKLSEFDPDSPWLKEAWRVKDVIERTRDGVSHVDATADAAAEAPDVSVDGDSLPFVPQIEPPMPLHERAAAAEHIKGLGNTHFKAGSLPQCVSLYKKALRYLDIHPPVPGEQGKATRLACLNNAAASYLKLNLPKKVVQYADNALKLESKNVKALFRKGSALRALSKYEEAVDTLQIAAAADPSDAGIKAELARADKELKKFRYGW